MGNNLFDADIAGILNDELGDSLLDGTLIRYTLGERDSTNLSAGRPKTPRNFPFSGMFDTIESKFVDGKQVTKGMRAVLILGDSISTVPATGDEIVLEGDTVKVVKLLERDPDAATYLLAVAG